MDRTNKHIITICTFHRHQSKGCRPGDDLIRRLRAAFYAALQATDFALEVARFAWLMACDRSCTARYYAPAKTFWLFDDADTNPDIDNLVAFAAQHAESEVGCFQAADRPGKLWRTAMARVPSLTIHSDRERLQ